MIGEPVKGDERLNRDLEAEIARHDDFFRLKHADTYDKLSDKTVMWFSAAVTTVDADFYLKVDDDIHLRVPELERFLVSHRLTRSMYFGCMKSGPVLSNPKQRWHEPEWWRFGDSGNRYFRHCTGQIRVSRTVAQYIPTTGPSCTGSPTRTSPLGPGSWDWTSSTWTTEHVLPGLPRELQMHRDVPVAVQQRVRPPDQHPGHTQLVSAAAHAARRGRR